MITLSKIKIKGYKSIASMELELKHINVIVGANGSGKSNLIGAFKFLDKIVNQQLQLTVASDPERLLHHGSKVTQEIFFDFTLGTNNYIFCLYKNADTLVFKYETVSYNDRWAHAEPIQTGHKESYLKKAAESYHNRIPEYVYPKVKKLTVFHFHDTSDESPAKRTSNLDDNKTLNHDGGNLAAFLYFIQEKHPNNFEQIRMHIQLVAPYFDRFILEPSKLNENKIKLEWRQKGSDAYFDAFSLSDGTLRFICLATLLLQPSLPGVILLDEPELGLHPSAINILAQLLHAASTKSQIILATQSVTLLDCFEPKDIVVAEHDGQATTFKRLDEDELAPWLERYSIGELWEKNVIGGRP